MGSHFHANDGLKAASVYLPIDEEASWLVLPGSVSVPSIIRVQPGNKVVYSYILTATDEL